MVPSMMNTVLQQQVLIPLAPFSIPLLKTMLFLVGTLGAKTSQLGSVDTRSLLYVLLYAFF